MELTPEQALIRDTVRELAQREFAPKAADADRELRPPVENLRVLAENGFLGIGIPESHGGAGLGLVENVIVLEEVARACANTAMLMSCTDGATPRTIQHVGSDAMKERYLPRFVKGELLAAWSMSEADAGSDVGNVKTRARLTGNRYVVNGAKLWCTGAQVADLFLVLVRLDDAPGMKGVGAILVDRDTKGFTIGRHLDLIGLRGTGMAELVFEDCEVPAENLLLPAGRMRELLGVLDADRVGGNPPVCLGVAAAAFTATVQYLNERKQFGKPLAEFQGLQWKLADMTIDIEAARALLYRTASRVDTGRASICDVSMAKTYVNEMARRVTDQAIQLHGAFGLSQDYPLERMARDVRGLSIGYGTTEIHRSSIAREVLAGKFTV